MLTPILYMEYIFSGLIVLFAAFLAIKEIFDTMKSKKKHIRRQLLVLTSAMLCIGVLTINRFAEIKRYDLVIKYASIPPNDPFLTLYNHLRRVMWCYVFLLFPITIYSIRNYWIQWKNQFASGEVTEASNYSQYQKMADDLPQQKLGS